MHLVIEYDGPALCGNTRSEPWSYDAKKVDCVGCLRASLESSEAALCRAREAFFKLRMSITGGNREYNELVVKQSAMSSLQNILAYDVSAPCPHAAALDWAINEGASWMPDKHSAEAFRIELRRRAGGEP